MSERTPSTRRCSYRLIVKALAGALVIGAACFALAASGTPGSVTAQGLGSSDKDIDAMNKAFADYMKSVKNMQKEFLSAATFGLDDAHAVGAYDLIGSFLNSTNRSQLTASGSGRRGYPRFAGFDDPDTRAFLLETLLDTMASGPSEQRVATKATRGQDKFDYGVNETAASRPWPRSSG